MQVFGWCLSGDKQMTIAGKPPLQAHNLFLPGPLPPRQSQTVSPVAIRIDQGAFAISSLPFARVGTSVLKRACVSPCKRRCPSLFRGHPPIPQARPRGVAPTCVRVGVSLLNFLVGVGRKERAGGAGAERGREGLLAKPALHIALHLHPAAAKFPEPDLRRCAGA